MFGFRTKAKPAELAVALLTTVWQGNDDEQLLTMFPEVSASDVSARTELFSLRYFVTLLGIHHVLSPTPAQCEAVKSMFNFLQSGMYGFGRIKDESPPGSDSDRAQADRFLSAALGDFARRYGSGMAQIERMRPFAPRPSFLRQRCEEYEEAFDRGFGQLQSGFKEVASRATTVFGRPRDPILQIACFTVIGARFSTISESLPKYKIVM